MKFSLQKLSYLGNVVAAGMIVYWMAGKPGERPSIGGRERVDPVAAQSSASPGARIGAQPLRWQNSDSAEIVRLLRSWGAPPEVIGDVVAAVLNRRYTELRNQVLYPPGTPRWQRRVAALTPAQRAEMDRLRLAFDADMRRLLGSDYEKIKLEAHASAFSPRLSSEKKAMIEQITADYQMAKRSSGQPLSPELSLDVEARLVGELKKILTPAELEEHLAYNSALATSLQQRLTGTNIDDQTYRKLYASVAELRELYLADDKRPAMLGSFDYRLRESAVIRDVVGDEVAAQIAIQQDRSFRPIESVLRASAESSATVLQKYQEYLRFHAEMEALHATSSSKEQTTEKGAPIAQRTYRVLTDGLSDAAKRQFDATPTGAFLVRLRGKHN